ncbi:MAG TPA: chemotaxis protein CheX [Vicinamibacterales bacterium]|nr:chemotaxis protein CheX [Vicinamibacterales bacterium]
MTSTDQDALQSAVIEVCENAYFVFVEACDAPQFATLVEEVRAEKGRGPSGRWLNASVAFHGASTGQVEVVLPERLGTWLVVSLLGLPADASLKDNQLLDGVGEFANMVCGAWLSKANETASFTLDVPKVSRMPAGWAPEPAPPDQEQAYRTVVVNDLPLEVRAR